MAYLSVIIYFLSQEKLIRKKEEYSIYKLLGEQIKNKEAQLKKTKQELVQLHEQLQEETALSVKYILDVETQRDSLQQLEKEIEDLKSYVIKESEAPVLNSSDIIYSPQSPMKEVMDLVGKVSSEDIPVLIIGETGTGKELIARAIHQNSSRNNSAFIAVNCGALSETLLESELFGHDKGSFTGASMKRRGRFELADGGTIFLDEISETSQAFQLRLLRVLQEGTFERIGSEQTLNVDVRIIAATNKDIQQEVNENRFRSDLFYRLNAMIIQLPPLSSRTEDLPILVRHFLDKYKYESVSEVSDRAMQMLKSYHWPGNIRELENTVRRSAILAKSAGRKMIQVEDFPKEISDTDMTNKIKELHSPLEDQILEILRALKFSRSSISKAAKALGNKDRGTITEYFRGICFEEYVQSGFDLQKTTDHIAKSSDSEIIENVRQKISEYIENLRTLVNTNFSADSDEVQTSSAYKGLPKKYHPALDQIIEYLAKQS